MDDIIDPVLNETDAFVAKGHQIIADNLAGAQRLAREYPAVATLLPLISHALHDLFAHMTSTRAEPPVIETAPLETVPEPTTDKSEPPVVEPTSFPPAFTPIPPASPAP